MRHGRFSIPPLICMLLVAGGTSRAESTEKFTWKNDENKRRMEMVEEIMRASADGTRKIFSEKFNKKED
ncbi:MAG: hypothetical protein HFI34_02010 [Lachnospiraceae bacterium]|nr:hypothetical protein [Lachnospiraceae bacterium]